MTTIESSKTDDRGHLLVEKDQNKQTVTLPPKKVMASKLAAAAAAAAAQAQAQAHAQAQAQAHAQTQTVQTNANTSNVTIQQSKSESTCTKRRLSSSIENTRDKKKAPIAKPAKSITHSDRIVQAEISQYRPCKFIYFPFVVK